MRFAFEGLVPGRQQGEASMPPLSEEAESIIGQWEIAQTALIQQLRFLQLRYRDAGRAEDAAAIAARVRQMQLRFEPAGDSATAELVNEGLQTQDDPVRMTVFRLQAGQTLTFAVRGRTDQTVYGTATYADDSGLETAAVHAGLIREGQRAIVKVKVQPGENSYDGSTQNGVQSSRMGYSGGSFRFAGVAVSRPYRTTDSMSSFRDLVDHSITIPVIGSKEESVWGDGIYSDNSSPAAAAVHAGILAIDEFGWIRISLLPGQSVYRGSSSNGVTSGSSGASEGSFRVERASPPYIVQVPGEDASELVNLDILRGRTDANFVVKIVASSTGGVWGTGVYTDDSSIATVAVHAGLLKDGEVGFVRVTVLPGRDRYAASVGNGVRSEGFGPWHGSFSLEGVAR
jgi:hypothetical protein